VTDLEKVKRRAISQLMRGLVPTFRVEGFARRGSVFVREFPGIRQKVTMQRHGQLEDRFSIRWYLTVEGADGEGGFLRRMDPIDGPTQVASVLMRPYGETEVATAIAWQAEQLISRIFPIAGRLTDPLSARAYSSPEEASKEGVILLEIAPEFHSLRANDR
jgi:hypothetical protein